MCNLKHSTAIYDRPNATNRPEHNILLTWGHIHLRMSQVTSVLSASLSTTHIDSTSDFSSFSLRFPLLFRDGLYVVGTEPLVIGQEHDKHLLMCLI